VKPLRGYVVRALLHKELLRHLANRGGLALMGLLVAVPVAYILLDKEGAAGRFSGGVRRCYLDYEDDGPLLAHLRQNVPPDLGARLQFRALRDVPADAHGTLVYPDGAGAIQLRRAGTPGGYKVWFWHPGRDESALAPYEAWFWRETLRFSQASAACARPASPAAVPFEVEHSSLTNGRDPHSGLATAVVLFGLYFVCVYLLPSLACEERERGTLLAQALSPATAGELLAARFLFYLALAVALAALLAGAYRPAALSRPFFWLTLLVAAAGCLGVGLTIAGLARTQRGAGLAALGYGMAVALLLFFCRRHEIPLLPHLAIEHHVPPVLHAALTETVAPDQGAHLGAAAVLAGGWVGLAYGLFRRRGWR
jgi:hypothetical protein